MIFFWALASNVDDNKYCIRPAEGGLKTKVKNYAKLTYLFIASGGGVSWPNIYGATLMYSDEGRETGPPNKAGEDGWRAPLTLRNLNGVWRDTKSGDQYTLSELGKSTCAAKLSECKWKRRAGSSREFSERGTHPDLRPVTTMTLGRGRTSVESNSPYWNHALRSACLQSITSCTLSSCRDGSIALMPWKWNPFAICVRVERILTTFCSCISFFPRPWLISLEIYLFINIYL